MRSSTYRQGVCIVLTGDAGRKVMVFHRVGMAGDRGWQFPQGGTAAGADLVEEARRELREEIGTDAFAVLKMTEKTYSYDFPSDVWKEGQQHRGQAHRWVLAEFLGRDSDIDFQRFHTPEFDDFEWITPAEALERIVGFKREAYKSALIDLGLLAPDSDPKQ